MKVYIYNNDGYFTKDHECQIGVFGEILYPSGNYTEEIITFETGKLPKFNGSSWELIDDNRGKIVYNKTTLEKIIWNEITEITSEYTEIKPIDDYYKWEETNWIFDVDKYKLFKKQELKGLIQFEWIDIDKTIEEIRIKWSEFKADAVNWNTKAKVDTAFNNAKSWLGL